MNLTGVVLTQEGGFQVVFEYFPVTPYTCKGGDRRLCNEKGNRYKDNDIGKLQYHLDHESKFIVTRKLFVMNHKSFTSSCLVVPGANVS